MQMEESIGNRLGSWIGEGWKMFAEQWKAWVVNALVAAAILALPIAPIVILAFVLMGQMSNSPDAAPMAFGGLFVLEATAALVVTVIVAYFSAGMYRSALKQLRGEQLQVSDLFSGGDCFFRMLGASLLIGILAGIGGLFCILPGLMVSGALFFTQFLIVDKGLGVIEAMQTSYEMCRKHIWWFTLFAFIVSLIGQIGSYACYVGILVTYPLIFTIGAVAYRDCFGIPGMRTFRDNSGGDAAQYNLSPTSFIPATPAPVSAVEDYGALDYGVCQSCQTPLTRAARFCPKCGIPTSGNPGGIGPANG
jgi:uncharacterized membrane protein